MNAVVIGYGNVLRGDDGAGPIVAEAIAAQKLPGVHVIVTPQLTPELAEVLAEVKQVFFVDASVALPGADVAVAPVQAGAGSESLGHVSDPGRLLALTQALYGAAPDAWIVEIPAVSFEIGAALSTVTREACDVAACQIRTRLEATRLNPAR